LNASKDELIKVTNERIVEVILKIRNNEIKYVSGHDGVYGKLLLFNDDAKQNKEFEEFKIQKTLGVYTKIGKSIKVQIFVSFAAITGSSGNFSFIFCSATMVASSIIFLESSLALSKSIP